MLGRVLGGVFSGSAPVVRNWGAAGARRGAVSRGQCVQQSVAAARARWGESRATVASCRGLATYSDDFLRDIPKSDLHVHLDGSVRVDTVCELAAEAGIELPGGATTPEELREAVYKPEFASLEEYLETFATTNLVAQTPAQMERIAYEFAVDNYSEGVRYFEVRYAPQLHAAPTFPVRDVMVAVNKGLERATAEFNERDAEVRAGEVPAYQYGIIICALRMVLPFFSRYYQAFFDLHASESQSRVTSLLSYAAAADAIAARDELGMPVVAFDIAGAEQGYIAKDHVDAFDLAHRNWLNKTVHAGEGFGPESIRQAISDLHAQRIGHGYNLFNAHAITAPGIDDPEAYVSRLAEHVARHRITLEVCLTSNEGTMPELVGALEKHALGQFLERNISVALCTDNRTVSRTDTVRELRRAVDTFDISPDQLKEIVVTGFKRSFFPGTYSEKRAWLAKLVAMYEAAEKKHGIVSSSYGQ